MSDESNELIEEEVVITVRKRKKTKVVNVKVAYIRPEYTNLEEWILDSKNVYIGRKGVLILNGRRFPEKDSVWANPFKIAKGDKSEEAREEVLEKYEEYIREKLEEDEELRRKLKK